MNGRTIAWAAVWFAAIAVGCSGGSAPADDQGGALESPDARTATATAIHPEIDPCTLLTAAEVEEVTGRTPVPAEPMAGMPACDWNPADGSGRMLVNVMARYGRTPASYEEYVEHIENVNERLAESLGDQAQFPYERVDGIGDFGVWQGDDQAGVLDVYQDDLSVSVTVDAAGGRTALDNARALAEKVMGRLP